MTESKQLQHIELGSRGGKKLIIKENSLFMTDIGNIDRQIAYRNGKFKESIHTEDVMIIFNVFEFSTDEQIRKEINIKEIGRDDEYALEDATESIYNYLKGLDLVTIKMVYTDGTGSAVKLGKYCKEYQTYVHKEYAEEDNTVIGISIKGGPYDRENEQNLEYFMELVTGRR